MFGRDCRAYGVEYRIGFTSVGSTLEQRFHALIPCSSRKIQSQLSYERTFLRLSGRPLHLGISPITFATDEDMQQTPNALEETDKTHVQLFSSACTCDVSMLCTDRPTQLYFPTTTAPTHTFRASFAALFVNVKTSRLELSL